MLETFESEGLSKNDAIQKFHGPCALVKLVVSFFPINRH
jgi:hypothetical protein